MEEPSRKGATFATQADALTRKNLSFQKRNMKENLCLSSFPIIICLLLIAIQKWIDSEFDKPKYNCGCRWIDKDADGTREYVCGIEYSTVQQAHRCPIPNPIEWPALMQVPRPEFRATKAGTGSFMGLEEESCRSSGTCPVTVLLTGQNHSFASALSKHFFTSLPNTTSFPNATSLPNASRIMDSLSNFFLGSDTETVRSKFLDPAFFSERPLYIIQQNCTSESSKLLQTMKVMFQMLENIPIPEIDIKCVNGTNLWRDSPSVVNGELFKGYRQASASRTINEIMAAFDFKDTDTSNFDVRVWYNSTYKYFRMMRPFSLQVRVAKSVNMVSNAYLKHLKGNFMGVQLDYTKEMPKPAKRIELDFSSLLGPVFFLWVVELLFPVMIGSLVYEKQHKLKIMMKMHGLGDGPYWLLSYAYFLIISTVYAFFLVFFGSLIGLYYFTTNDYSLQFVFYFSFINLQIALAFVKASAFSNVKTARATAYIYVFGTGLLSGFLFHSLITDSTFPSSWVCVMMLIPPFALYRGLYEFGQYSFSGRYMGTSGMHWKNLHDSENGMKEVLIIIVVEWVVLLPISYYIDRRCFLGRHCKVPSFSLSCFNKGTQHSLQNLSLQEQRSEVLVNMDKPDVMNERKLVERLLLESNRSRTIICDNLRKVYPASDGNLEKLAVQGLSLALPNRECFGVLGPNGAGKTTFINMMIGLITPSSGKAYVQGYSIETDMDQIYTDMGVCPQHDMLWGTLTGREHLLFYGRLKNLKGSALFQAVEESLKNVDLFYGGVADRQAGRYSGGMRRRLSVAISLIGNPKVVYMDEPSTGLDPASRNNLWKVVKNSKENKTILLTTHSMEEAEVLCDRLAIFANGALECIGNPKELKARYGGTYVFTMTTSASKEQEVENLVNQLSPNVNKIYHIPGTQKFEIPKQDIKIADVFQAVEAAKRRFTIYAWGLSDTTLEDVFIKVAKGAGPVDSSS